MKQYLVRIAKLIELFFGEIFVKISSFTGIIAAKFLFHAQWGYNAPEWFAHRLHVLDPNKYFTDYWTASADNVVRALPLGGRLLNLCSGDGFYDQYFYRKRAAEITCIEFNREVHDFAVKHHSDKKITYILGDVLSYPLAQSYYDVVCVRGAIEHFSPDDQQKIFTKSFDALKPGGYFCGDTPAKKKGVEKQLPSHEYEWSDEQEMRRVLNAVFSEIETWSIVSEGRTTLFWRCKK